MNIHADKTTEAKSNAVANGFAVKQSTEQAGFQLENNRPEAIVQRTIKETANNSKQVIQLKNLQSTASNGKKVNQLKTLAEAGSNNLQQHPSQLYKAACNDNPGAAPVAGERILQRVGPEYEENSPEKKQTANLKESWEIIGAEGMDLAVVIDQRIFIIEQQMPGIPVKRIKDAVIRFQAEGIEAVWKNILFDSTDAELEGMFIGGRYNKWQLIKSPLGVGTEATVYWGFKFTGGKPVAIKIFKGNDERYENVFRKEISAHKLLQEFEEAGDPIPNVVRMLDYNTYIKSVIMEQVPGYPLDKLKEELEFENKKSLMPGAIGKIDIDKVIERMEKRKPQAISETQRALNKHGYALGDLQDRNIMYDYIENKITFIDISFEKIHQ